MLVYKVRGIFQISEENEKLQFQDFNKKEKLEKLIYI